MPSEDLKKYDRWSPAAERLIAESGPHVVLRDVVKEYWEAVSRFHNWFHGALVERHREELDEFAQRSDELAREWKEAVGETS